MFFNIIQLHQINYLILIQKHSLSQWVLFFSLILIRDLTRHFKIFGKSKLENSILDTNIGKFSIRIISTLKLQDAFDNNHRSWFKGTSKLILPL